MAGRAIVFAMAGAAIGGVTGGVDAMIDPDPNRHFSDGATQGAYTGATVGAFWTFRLARPVIGIIGAALGGYGVGEALDDGKPTLAMYRGALLGAGIYFGTPRLRSIQEIGEIGEARAIKFLKKNGHTDIICIKNAAGNGLDVVSRTPDQRLNFTEVKATDGGNIADLKPNQRDMKPYVLKILEQARTGTGRFKGVDAATKQAAENLFNEYTKDPSRVSGTLVGIDIKKGTVHVSPWPGRPGDPSE